MLSSNSDLNRSIWASIAAFAAGVIFVASGIRRLSSSFVDGMSELTISSEICGCPGDDGRVSSMTGGRSVNEAAKRNPHSSPKLRICILLYYLEIHDGDRKIKAS